MDRQAQINACIEGFLDDIRAMMQGARQQSLEALRRSLGSSQAKGSEASAAPAKAKAKAAKPAAPKKAARPRKAEKRAPEPKKAAPKKAAPSKAAPPKKAVAPRKAAPAKKVAEKAAPPQTAPHAAPAAGEAQAAGRSPSERENAVLEAVRFLVRATTSEIAQRAGLPNGSAHVALRSLLAGGRVARSETARGNEYSLVSTGSVRPFKRAAAPEGAPPRT
jgi:outer membrane biosynthesis protein TonB